jgi:hypothetical protein
MPVILALSIVFGLLAALLGTGIWHLMSWTALSIPVLVIAWYAFRLGGRFSRRKIIPGDDAGG